MIFKLNTAKEMHVETIRGLACLGLVSFHVIGDTPLSGMELPLDDWLVHLQACFAHMRMPLFSFISGYVFVSFASKGRSWSRLWLSKVRRLLLPLLSVGLLYWGVREAMGYSQPDWLHALLYPYLHFWFLQATFVLMTVALAINWLAGVATGREANVRRASIIAALLGALGAVLHVSGVLGGIKIFSTDHVFYLAPFFMAGHILALRGKAVFAALCERHRWMGGVGLALAVLAGALLAFDWLVLSNPIAIRAAGLGIGLLTAFSLFVLQPRVRLLAWIGDKSYAIYLFHVLFLAALTELWRATVPLDIHWVYLPALCAGLVGPILLQAALLRSGVLSWLFLGLRLPRRAPRGAVPSASSAG